MLSLKSVGHTTLVTDDFGNHYQNVEVVMVIKAPRGLLALYSRPEKSPQLTSQHQEEQAEIIKAFMELNHG